MASYRTPTQEIQFILNDVVNAGRLAAEIPAFAEATPDLLNGLVDEAAKLGEEVIAPLRATADIQGCRWDNGEVTVPDGFANAYKMLSDGGWIGLASPIDFGGQGLPYTLAKVVDEIVSSANVAFALYPGLTAGCFEGIHASASEELKALYLPKLATGEWAGTMCLTEPGAGSDLASVKTRAIPQEDGSYRLEGAKIFISSGEHTMTENIVHFVLARMVDSPPGVKGLSTFIVPKYMVNADASLGARNAVVCTGIEHKMGINGSCTCQIAFDGATGYLVGEPNAGIANMFVMMNNARILVALQGMGLCELATQNAIRYAQERKQGRSISGKTTADVAIIDHADVRRMLLRMKAINEGARVLAYDSAVFVDLSHHHPDAAVREEAQDWVELNTPLAKAFITDAAFELGSLAVQVYGGHGYIREHGVEQIVRDAKILAIYEGTNGIQAMDLVRRKLMLRGGRLPQRFFARVRAELDADPAFSYLTAPLSTALQALEDTALWLTASFKERPEDAGYGAVDFLRAFSLTYLGWAWLRMVKAAANHSDPVFRQLKTATAHYFASHMLIEVPMLCSGVRAGAEDAMDLPAEAF